MDFQIDWDMLFYYGEKVLDQQVENEFDLWSGLLQPKRSMLYFRREGVGLQQQENKPNGLTLLLDVRFSIIIWVAYRNTYVSNGRNNLPDRRLAVSQQSIGIQQTNDGRLDVQVFYIALSKSTELQKTGSII